MEEAELREAMKSRMSDLVDQAEPWQLDVLDAYLRAGSVFLERDSRYGGLWRKGGYRDAADQIKSKAKRIVTETNRGPSYETDDALDLMNYSAFWLVCVEGNNPGDDW